MRTLRLEEARALLWDTLTPGPVERRPALDAVGLVLAEDVRSDRPFPPYHRMAMDGYAVRAADTTGASPQAPVTLRVIGAVTAGAPTARRLERGTCMKAMTGGVLPEGADAVVRVEDTGGYSDERAEVYVAVEAGQNVAHRGEDLPQGEIVVPAGTRLGNHHVQALASTGCVEVPVIAPPSAAVLATGDELVPATAAPGPAQIRESNSACAVAVLADLGIEATALGIVSDNPRVLRERLPAALAQYELVVLSGGVSKGEKDFVKHALREAGVSLHFESLHLRPGHPSTFGTHAGGFVFALPGNPVAVFATLAWVFAVGLRRRLGYPTPMPPAQFGRLAFAAHRKGARPQLLPVRCHSDPEGGLPRLDPTGHRGSGDFVSLAQAQALAWLGDHQDRFGPGEVVPIVPLPLAWPS
jgi:molybdenum cofactor synthesis domain-containing protein